jgi:hypothetical protein
MPKNKPKWSSLEEQLVASKAAKRSALEQLIRDNQDFEMLRPEEAGDKLGLPPWLRVYWRKLHPDAQYMGRSGGYPLSLADLYEWMVDHQDLNPPKPDVVDPTDPRRARRSNPKGGERGGRRGH